MNKYTLEEFENKLVNKEFSFDMKGHSFNEEFIIYYILDKIKSSKRLFENHPKLKNEKTSRIEIGKSLLLGFVGIRFKCSHKCGEYYNLGLLDSNTITVFKKDYSDSNCVFIDGIPPIEQTFDFQNELIFTNAFRGDDNRYLLEDCPEGMKYSKEYDLCTESGIINITKYKNETQNVLFAQMGNMGMSIYRNKKQNHIIIGTSYLEEYPETEKYLNDNDFEDLGYICLDVWRFEASDIKTLKKHNYVKKENDVNIKISSGKWKFTHYLNSTISNKLEIYSELKKV